MEVHILRNRGREPALCELRKTIPGISQKVLTETPRMEADGIIPAGVSRGAAESRVRATKLGNSMRPIIAPWTHGAVLQAHTGAPSDTAATLIVAPAPPGGPARLPNARLPWLRPRPHPLDRGTRMA